MDCNGSWIGMIEMDIEKKKKGKVILIGRIACKEQSVLREMKIKDLY